ncbi:MAG: type III-B CRISPR-associated protein Cas10/Cmr2, partial [Okeania sp. SIO3C4]|nr:type III-B CRISPR-associated protein Cas10/Cmr2 [Okeania sp. SIO3C4]
FRSRLESKDKQEILKEKFENVWCAAKTNDGNLAPWMYDEKEKLYETIWREIVDIYEFIEIEEKTSKQQTPKKEINR